MAKSENNIIKISKNEGVGGFFAFLAYIGAAIYFIQQSNGGFWEVILALLQAIVWPVYFIFHLLKFLGA